MNLALLLHVVPSSQHTESIAHHVMEGILRHASLICSVAFCTLGLLIEIH